MLKPSINLPLLKFVIFLCLSYSTSAFAMSDNLKCSPVSEYHYKTLNKDLMNVQAQVETGTLFLYAKDNFNKYPSCRYENDDTGLLLIYEFNKSVTLKSLSNSSLKLNSKSLLLPSNSNLNEANAIALLQTIEKQSFNEKGCGINWNKPVVETNKNNSIHQKTWWGDICNCKADLVLKNTAIIQISFQTAC